MRRFTRDAGHHLALALRGSLAAEDLHDVGERRERALLLLLAGTAQAGVLHAGALAMIAIVLMGMVRLVIVGIARPAGAVDDLVELARDRARCPGIRGSSRSRRRSSRSSAG